MADTLIEKEQAPAQSAGAAWKSWVATTLAVILTLCGIASVVALAIEMNLGWFHGGDIVAQAKAFAASDVDQDVFLKRVHEHWSFLSTFAWWHQAWVGKDLPHYWRPLSMYAFWIEDHLFGAWRFDRWQGADIVFFVAFALVLALFAYRITGSRVAPGLTLLLFTCFAPLPGSVPVMSWVMSFASSFTTPGGNVVVENWKDQAESWCGIFTLLALIFTLGERWWAALVSVIVAICFKESGWFIFPMILVLLLYTGNLKKVPRSIWIASVVSSAVLIALRASAGWEVFIGYHGGAHPHDKVSHFLLAVTDQNTHALATTFWAIPLLGFSIAWLVLCARLKPIPRLVTGIVLFFLAGAAVGLSNQTDPFVGITLIMDPHAKLIPLFYCFIFGLAVILAFREPRAPELMATLYALVLLSAIPIVAVLQPNEHMLYLTNGFQSLLVAWVSIAAVRQLPRLMKRPASNAPIPVPAPAAESGAI